MSASRLPRFARALVMLRRLGPERTRVEADLHELFRIRAADRGRRYASWRLLRDALSVKGATTPQALSRTLPSIELHA